MLGRTKDREKMLTSSGLQLPYLYLFFVSLNWLLLFGGFWGTGEQGHLFQENKATDI